MKEGKTLEDLLEQFSFLGGERAFIADFSASWEQVAREEETDIADAVVNYLIDGEMVLQPLDAVRLIRFRPVETLYVRSLTAKPHRRRP